MSHKENDSKNRAYFLLYRFLRENNILNNYLENLYNTRKYIRSNYKETLHKLVDAYQRMYCSDNYVSLFNYAPSGFYWDGSIEGAEFWYKYHRRWEYYFNVNKKKYGLL